MVERPHPVIPIPGQSNPTPQGVSRLLRGLELGFELLFLGALEAAGTGLMVIAPAFHDLAAFIVQSAVAFGIMRRRLAWGWLGYLAGAAFVATSPDPKWLALQFVFSTIGMACWMTLVVRWPTRAPWRWLGMVGAVWVDRALTLGTASGIPGYPVHTIHQTMIWSHLAAWFLGPSSALWVVHHGPLISVAEAALWGTLIFYLNAQAAWYYAIHLPLPPLFGQWRPVPGLNFLYALILAGVLTDVVPRFEPTGIVLAVLFSVYFAVYGANVAWVFFRRFPPSMQAIMIMVLLMAGLGTAISLVALGLLDEWWNFRRWAIPPKRGAV